MNTRAQPGIFFGKGVFLELWHFDKQSIYDTRKKDPARKNLPFLLLNALENCILNEKFNP